MVRNPLTKACADQLNAYFKPDIDLPVRGQKSITAQRGEPLAFLVRNSSAQRSSLQGVRGQKSIPKGVTHQLIWPEIAAGSSPPSREL